MERVDADGDPIPDDWTVQRCPLCGHTDLLPPGWECHRVRQARAEGKLPPTCCTTCGGQGYIGDGGYIACPTCHPRDTESEA